MDFEAVEEAKAGWVELESKDVTAGWDAMRESEDETKEAGSEAEENSVLDAKSNVVAGWCVVAGAELIWKFKLKSGLSRVG